MFFDRKSFSFFGGLLRQREDVAQGEIAQEFAYGYGAQRLGEVHSQDSEGNGNDGAQYRQPCQQAHPCAVGAYLLLAAVQLLLLHAEETINPSLVAHPPDAIVEQAPQHIADGGSHYQRPQVQAAGKEPREYHLRAERYEAAGQKGGHSHARVAVLHKKFSNAQK